MKVALVTGGSRGIGRAIVEEFHGAGYSVAFTYSSNDAAAREVTGKLGPGVMAMQADVRNFERAGEVVAETIATYGPISALVNNAGIKKDLPLMKMRMLRPGGTWWIPT